MLECKYDKGLEHKKYPERLLDSIRGVMNSYEGNACF